MDKDEDTDEDEVKDEYEVLDEVKDKDKVMDKDDVGYMDYEYVISATYPPLVPSVVGVTWYLTV